ncbi:MAG: sodium-dependent transporter, partial [Muribaculaceae bacterium]|nr:sodium-dependent transporter [Muribaculaceae bacterium]
ERLVGSDICIRDRSMLWLGIPVMIAEFALGRGGRSDAEGVFRKLAPESKWWIAGALAILASYIILSFYMVVAGWTFEYLWQSITGNLYETAGSSNALMEKGFHEKMEEYICGDWNPLFNTYILILLNLLILMGGVQKGIERMSNILMPILFCLLLIFAGVSLSLPGAGEGLKFFFTPDFSKITLEVVVNALGQSFFSLSLGMGILITYSSYYPDKTKLAPTAFTVSVLDMLVALLMGIIIFPAVASFGLEGSSLRGTTLVFVTLPEIFASMPLTRLWSILFFLLLMVAALTSTISIAEVSVAWLQDRFKKSRKAACLIVILPLFILSAVCSLSFGSLNFIKIFGLGIFDFLDTFATNILLPLVSILVCLFLGWKMRPEFLRKQVTNHGVTGNKIYPYFSFIIKYCAPPLLFIILLGAFIDF